MLKIAYIKEISKGKWRVLSKKGRNLGTYNSKEQAEKRLKQVEFFKHWPFHPIRKKKAVQNLYNKIVLGEESAESASSLVEATSTFSAEMRELRKNNPEKVMNFLKQFNQSFQNSLQEGIENPEQAALLETKLATKSK
jgi:CRISPR/Cas system CSM-associated protein Csm4 (group 5 of RAMP superfamily)